MERYDVVILGAGTGGQTAAHDLAAEGYSVAVVEASPTPGGVCALHGCQAKKWLYEVTDAVARCNHLKGLGVTTPPQVNWREILTAKNSFTAKIPANTVKSLRGSNVTYLEGWGRLRDATSILVNDTQIEAGYIIVATGATPMKLPIPGGEHLITSNDFLDLDALPKRIVFIGGGFISFEFAHFAARLGARPGDVHILEVQERPLAPFDSDMVEQLVAASNADGIQVHTGISITSINKNADSFTVTLADGGVIETDLVVNGAGRVPNIAPLNLESAGVNFSRRGIKVNEKMQTNIPNIFAIGDCAETLQLARVADKEAHIAAVNIIAQQEGSEHQGINYCCAPAVLFTYPQLAMVGKTEDELKKENVRYWRSFETNLGWPTYRRIGMQFAAFKILVDDEGRILGAHILSDNATGLINTIKQAMLDRMPVSELYASNIMSPYPSRESDIIYMLSPLLD
jgi:glutathione reductase (NADPH)